MIRKVFGFDQTLATSLGLDITDLMILYIIKGFCKSKTKKRRIGDEEYSWVSYATILEDNPILRIGRRMLAKRLDALAAKGIIKKEVVNDNGTFTYFRFIGVPVDLQGGVTPVTGGVEIKLHPKKIKDINNKEKKEKDISDEISQKKNNDFDSLVKDFKEQAFKDDNLKFSLRGYHITDMDALLDAFINHAAKLSRVKDIRDKGYANAKAWMLHSMPHLDLTKATGISLGYGEYIKNGKRLYKNRYGSEIEVPRDAPPRRQGTIWYKEQGRWGPDT